MNVHALIQTKIIKNLKRGAHLAELMGYTRVFP